MFPDPHSPIPPAPSLWDKWKPLTMKFAALLLAALSGGVANQHLREPRTKEVAVPASVMVCLAESTPPVAAGAVEHSRTGSIKRLAGGMWRGRVIERLQK